MSRGIFFFTFNVILLEHKDVYYYIYFESEDHTVQSPVITNNRKIIPCPQISYKSNYKARDNKWKQMDAKK